MKRFYREFLPAFLTPITVFTHRGFQLFQNSPSIQVLSQTRQTWDHFLAMQEGDTKEHILEFYQGKEPKYPTDSMIVQTQD